MFSKGFVMIKRQFHARVVVMIVIFSLLAGGLLLQPTIHDAAAQTRSTVQYSYNPERQHVHSGSISFFRQTIFNSSSALTGASLFDSPTGMIFGPDGRLYVSQFNGRIFAITLNPTNHQATAVQVIETIYNYPNTNDDGSPATGVNGRQLIGILFDPASTPSNMILYVSHSDPRYGYNSDTTSQKINTRSGTISKLVSTNNFATSTDIIKGLPRSRENHSTNSIVWGPDGWMYISSSSNTNNGAPSAHFSNLAEYYLSAAILRANVRDAGFPSAGIDVKNVNNAAALAPFAGQFEMYATGYRNVYDFIWLNNKFYANVNGGNDGYGDTPSAAQCPGGVEINPRYLPDTLKIVTQGSYGGHPNPARGECVLNNGNAQGLPTPPNYNPPALTYDFRPSTNGITAYISNAFGGALQGNLIVATYGQNQDVSRVQLDANGNPTGIQTLAKFNQPLDVVTDAKGVIYVAEFGSDAITILEPEDLPNCPPPPPYSSMVDSDNDGYSDFDEDQNATNLCSRASVPNDFDGDMISDLTTITMASLMSMISCILIQRMAITPNCPLNSIGILVMHRWAKLLIRALLGCKLPMELRELMRLRLQLALLVALPTSSPPKAQMLVRLIPRPTLCKLALIPIATSELKRGSLKCSLGARLRAIKRRACSSAPTKITM